MQYIHIYPNSRFEALGKQGESKEYTHALSSTSWLWSCIEQLPVPGLGDPMAKRGPQVAYKMPMAISVLSFG